MSRRVYNTLAPYAGALGKIPVTYSKGRLDKSDADLFRFAMTLRTALLYDLLPSEQCEAGLNAAYRTLLNVKSIDAYVFGQDVKTLGKALRQYANEHAGSVVTRGAFTRSLGLTYGSLLLSGARPLLDQFLADPSSAACQPLLTYVDFMTKLNFRSIDLEEDMVAEYDAQERSMSQWVYDADTISQLRSIITEWFSDFSVDLKDLCHHGSGATAQTTGRTRSRLVKGAVASLPHDLYLKVMGWGADERYFLDDPEYTVKPSQVVFVPKSMTTKRVISKEDTSLQFLQQGLKELFYSYFKRHTFLRRVIDLEHQERSQHLACLGSRDGSYATYDLSAASDSVSSRLVSEVFADLPTLHDALLSTRSTWAEYQKNDGTKLRWRMNKFAPMGSAVCFPIETIIFSAICELCRRKSRSRKLFRVYGDDIVVPDEYADDVGIILSFLHFKVNVAKSYGGFNRTMFREACGGEYVNGVNVTPVRLSRQLRLIKLKRRRNNVVRPEEGLESMIGLANRLFDANLLCARSYVLRYVRESVDDDWFFAIGFTEDDTGFKTCNPDNRRAKSRYNREYQCVELLRARQTYLRQAVIDQTWAVKPLISDDLGDIEYARLESWLVETEQRTSHFDAPDAVMQLLSQWQFGLELPTALYCCLQLRPAASSLGSILIAPRTWTRTWVTADI